MRWTNRGAYLIEHLVALLGIYNCLVNGRDRPTTNAAHVPHSLAHGVRWVIKSIQPADVVVVTYTNCSIFSNLFESGVSHCPEHGQLAGKLEKYLVG